MQFRISPGGRTLKSRRNRPELPPSSETVTTAVKSVTSRRRSAVARGKADSSLCSSTTYFLSPRSNVERPVPPPMETIFISVAREPPVIGPLLGKGRLFRIEQFRKTRVLAQAGKVGVV